MRKSSAEGKMEKMLCSKVRVKSKSLVELAGPKAQSLARASAIVPLSVRLEAIDQ
jgi:hypothetical protein